VVFKSLLCLETLHSLRVEGVIDEAEEDILNSTLGHKSENAKALLASPSLLTNGNVSRSEK
jgi:hypothetical protein